MMTSSVGTTEASNPIESPRAAQTISLASPFAGVPGARLVGLGDLEPGSLLLGQIRLDLGHATLVPHLSIVATYPTSRSDQVGSVLKTKRRWRWRWGRTRA
jgi:hypothetical protein